MLAGTLDRRVIWQQATKTQDDFGNDIERWETIFETWCAKLALRGNEIVAPISGETVDELPVKIQIRYRAGIGPMDRFIFEGRVHRVQSIEEIGRRDGQEVIGLSRADLPAAVES